MLESSHFRENKEKGCTIDELLPNASELKPVHENSTFADCGFVEGRFEDQTIEMQLKVANDIVRQANLIDYYPTEEGPELSGDCVITASYLVEYINKLGIPGETFLASVRKNPFDGGWRSSTRHMIVLHKDGEGNYRTVDPTTMVGYGYGTVGPPATFENGKLTSKQKDQDQIYEEVVLLGDQDLQIINDINGLRRAFYEDKSATIESCQAIIDVAKRDRIGAHMNAWMSEVYYVLAVLQHEDGLTEESQQSISKTIELNPLKPKVIDISSIRESDRRKIEQTLEEYRQTAEAEGSKWLEEAKKIFEGKEEARYQEGIRYLQWAFRELKGSGIISETIPSVEIGGKTVYLYNINPRILSEHNLGVVWIKPSSDIAGVSAAAREAVTPKGKSIFEYGIEPTKPLDGGLIPLSISHPHGKRDENVLAYSGPMKILLVEKAPHELEKIKIRFRREWGHNMRKMGEKGGETRWFDDQSIVWNEWLTNYIHTSDCSAEASVHLLLGYPHLSLVDRWNYPHPFL